MTTCPHRLEHSAQVDDRMASHPLVTAAANGCLPDWVVAEPGRVAHMTRVAHVLDSWAEELGLTEEERVRWRAAGYLHDALRDATPSSLRSLVPGGFADVPDALLHGPAAAERLRTEGVADEELLAAVAFHTIGDASFGRLGRALYSADFLEPGRTFLVEQRAELRVRAPAELYEVTFEVARARIASLVDRKMELHPWTVAFWNTLVAERHE